MPNDPLRLDNCPLCGGHVQYSIGLEGQVTGLFCQGCRCHFWWADQELKLKPREQFGAQMARWAAKWNNRRKTDGKGNA